MPPHVEKCPANITRAASRKYVYLGKAYRIRQLYIQYLGGGVGAGSITLDYFWPKKANLSDYLHE